MPAEICFCFFDKESISFRDGPFLDVNRSLCALVVNMSSKELSVLRLQWHGKTNPESRPVLGFLPLPGAV